MKQYTSFLVCFHENQTNVYISGIPLAVITSKGVEINKVNPLLLPDTQFKTVEELSIALNRVVEALCVSIPNENSDNQRDGTKEN